MLDGLGWIGGAPIRPLPILVLHLLGGQSGSDLLRRVPSPPRAIERQQDNVDPFFEIARIYLDLPQFLADMIDDASGARTGTEGAFGECALPITVRYEIEGRARIMQCHRPHLTGLFGNGDFRRASL